MFDQILIPTDGSESAEEAITTGLELAAEQEATVHALYAVEPIPLGRYAAGMRSAGSEHNELSERQQKEAEEATTAVSEMATKRDTDVVEAIEYGEPDNVITTYATDNDIDLIVMGTHGRSGADRLVIGSVAEKVVRSSDVPVMTVRE